MIDPQLNVYHVQLLNEIAQYGGISAAAKNNHGPNPSTISTQITELESVLGGKLFLRHPHPFELTPLGKRWCEPARLFFLAVNGLMARAKENPAFTFRLGASHHVLSRYIMDVLHIILRYAGAIQFNLETPRADQVYSRLLDLSLDVAIAPLYGDLPGDLEVLPLMALPLVLVIPNTEKYAPIRSAATLWRQKDIGQMLIRPFMHEPAAQVFHQELRLRGVQWTQKIQVESLELVTALVKQGAGVGLSVGLPTLTADPAVRVLPLSGFPQLKYGLIWNTATREYCAPLREAVQASASTRFKVRADGTLAGLRRGWNRTS